MKKILLLLFVSVCANSINVYGQAYTTDVSFHMPFDSSYVVGQGMIDSFDINQNFQAYNTGQFVLCDNSTFTFKGNQSSSAPSFYMYPGSTLILNDAYFYPTVYMVGNAHLDAQFGNQNITCYHEIMGTMSDTNNVNWLKDTIVASMNFTFTNWPNASAPCTVSPPQSVKAFENLPVNLFVKNGMLNYSLFNEKPTELYIYDLHGRELVSRKISFSGQLDLSQFASGIYLVHLKQAGKVAKRKIYLD